MSGIKKGLFFISFFVIGSLLVLSFYTENRQEQKSNQDLADPAASEAGKSAHRIHIHYIGPQSASAASETEKQTAYSSMSGPGKKIPLGSGHYFLYGFDKKPKLGIVIMKVEVFTREGKKDTSFQIKADADMPSMRGAHGTGDRPFTLSKKGDYLLPVDIVMPGDWEIRLTLVKEGKVIFRGSYAFNV
ncbi:MAG: hypothetical protein HY879_02125 [Deltaproteobacteria bacterium]|nr:hypothetical protein [Deltaproteobacteria bacterium]